MPSQAEPSGPMNMPRAATISPSSRATYSCHRAADQALEPDAGVEPVDPLQELGPLVGGLGAYPFHGEPTLGRRSDAGRVAVAEDPVLSVEGLETPLAEQILVALRPAVRLRGNQEHRDPVLVPA